MKFSTDIIECLDKQIDKENIAHREGSRGMKLSYLETWFVIEQANRIFGYDNWSYSINNIDTKHYEVTNKYNKQVTETVATAHIRVQVGDVFREDVGSGHNISPTIVPDPDGMAVKGAVSDALKRCFRTFGNQFGNSLYDKDFLLELEKPEEPLKSVIQPPKEASKIPSHQIKEKGGVDLSPASVFSPEEEESLQQIIDQQKERLDHVLSLPDVFEETAQRVKTFKVAQKKEIIKRDPVVQKVLDEFPGAQIDSPVDSVDPGTYVMPFGSDKGKTFDLIGPKSIRKSFQWANGLDKKGPPMEKFLKQALEYLAVYDK